MMGKVNYPGHALHGKTVELDGETQIGYEQYCEGSNAMELVEICAGYRIPMPEGHVILLPKDKIRVLAE